MIRNRRQYPRQDVNSPAYVALGAGSGGILHDLCEGGLAVDMVGTSPTNRLFLLEFNVPGTEHRIETSAEIAWKDKAGKGAGMRFVDLPETSRQHIKDWVSLRTGAADVVSPAADPPPASQRDDELLKGIRSALFQAVEVHESRQGEQVTPEQEARDRQRRRKLVLAGVAGGLAVLVGVAGIAFFLSHREEIVAELGDFKKTITGIFKPSVTGPPPIAATRRDAAKSRTHRRSESTAQPGETGQSPAPGAADLLGQLNPPAKQAKPFQIEVVDPQNQRHVVTPRGSTRIRVNFEGPAWANRPATGAAGGRSGAGSADSALLATAKAAGAAPSRISRETSGEVPTEHVMPAYPLLALEKNIQGTVVVQVLIGKDGTIRNVRLVSGHPTLASAVMDAVKQWRYKTIFRDGEPVEVERRITVDFTITAED